MVAALLGLFVGAFVATLIALTSLYQPIGPPRSERGGSRPRFPVRNQGG